MPFIVGIAGSVAVGKSTSARVLRELLARWPAHQRVDLVPTDGFLLPNAELERRGIMHRKGFPESFDQARLLRFVADVKAGRANVEAPVYSHFSYDIVPGEKIVVDRPDILIVEGLNLLQPAKLPRQGEAVPFVSDFFDFSIYIDAETGADRAVVCDALPPPLAHGLPRQGRLFLPLFETEPRAGRRAGVQGVAVDQPRQFEEKHFADAPARQSDLEQGRGASRRNGILAQALSMIRANLKQ